MVSPSVSPLLHSILGVFSWCLLLAPLTLTPYSSRVPTILPTFPEPYLGRTSWERSRSIPSNTASKLSIQGMTLSNSVPSGREGKGHICPIAFNVSVHTKWKASRKNCGNSSLGVNSRALMAKFCCFSRVSLARSRRLFTPFLSLGKTCGNSQIIGCPFLFFLFLVFSCWECSLWPYTYQPWTLAQSSPISLILIVK